MKVSINGLQRSTHNSFQRFTFLLKDALIKDRRGKVKFDPDFDSMSELQDAFDELRNDLVFVCSLIDKETGKAWTEDDKIKFNLIDFVEDEDEDY